MQVRGQNSLSFDSHRFETSQTDEFFESPSYWDAFDDRAAELFRPVTILADNAVEYWVERGGVAGAIGGTLAGALTENNIGNTILVASTGYLGGGAAGAGRQAYVGSVTALGARAQALRTAGFGEQAIARFLVRGRNAIKDRFRGPFARLLNRYHRPTLQQLQTVKTVEQIQAGALRTNSGVNRILGAGQ